MAPKPNVRYVEVAPCVPLGKRGQDSYTYFVSTEEKLFIGSVVKIPFGKRAIMGVVTVLDVQKPSYPTKQVKTITNVQLTDIQIKYAAWLADMAHGGFGFTARLFLPSSFAKVSSSSRGVQKSKKKIKIQAIIEQDADTRREMIKKIVATQTGQILIVVPEVSMIDEYVKLFHAEIQDKTAVAYHAGLLQSEKKDVWSAVDSSQCRIIIGTQKALFLPFNNLASVVIVEEQIESYKLWDQYPRLHTVLGAEQLAGLSKASIFYVSSYPSLYLRHLIAEKKCEVLRDNPLIPQVTVYAASFEDRKWKRQVPDELGGKIRTWARSRKHVLIIWNKKDTSELKKSLLRKLSTSAKQHIYIGTMGILTHPPIARFDYVVWLSPEWTVRSIDYRSAERAKIIVARMAGLTASRDVYMGTRYGDIVKEVFGISEKKWLEKTVKERKRFGLPPYTQLVHLTVNDKTNAKAHTRAEVIRDMISTSSVIIYGPYRELSANKKVLHEYQILLSGDLEKLIPLYKKLPIDSADVAPYRIV